MYMNIWWMLLMVTRVEPEDSKVKPCEWPLPRTNAH